VVHRLQHSENCFAGRYRLKILEIITTMITITKITINIPTYTPAPKISPMTSQPENVKATNNISSAFNKYLMSL
jgi:hypothetical protein